MNPSLAIPRDTTSPTAIADDLKSVLLGNVLSSASRDQLTLWMEANLTGLERLRRSYPKAGAPPTKQDRTACTRA